MTQADQVLDRLPGADGVVVADHVDRALGDSSADLDDGHLIEERLEVAPVQIGTDDDEPFAAVAEQLVDHGVLPAAGVNAPSSRW